MGKACMNLSLLMSVLISHVFKYINKPNMGRSMFQTIAASSQLYVNINVHFLQVITQDGFAF